MIYYRYIVPKHLIMVTASANNNKYYNMTPHGDTWTAEYRRVGSSSQRREYSIREWDNMESIMHQKLKNLMDIHL